MKTVIGNNNFVIVKNIDGTLSQKIALEVNTSLITSANTVNVFNTQPELITYISSTNVSQFPAIPSVGNWCEMNVVYAYGVNKAKCLQSHNRMNFTPEETPALFQVIITIVGYPVWRQPAGANDAYQKGDRVHFPLIGSPVYESKINANVWSPTGYPAGWTLIL